MLPHTVVVDFAVSLLLVSVACDLLGQVAQEQELHVVGYWCLLIGAAAACFAVLSGFTALSTADPTGAARTLVLRHRNFAIAVASLFVPLAGWRLLGGGKLPDKPAGLYWLVAFVGVTLLVVTAWLGGTAVFRHGVGVQLPR